MSCLRLTCCRKSATLWGGEIHQTSNTVIDALLSVAKRQPACHINGLEWKNIARWQRF